MNRISLVPMFAAIVALVGGAWYVLRPLAPEQSALTPAEPVSSPVISESAIAGRSQHSGGSSPRSSLGELEDLPPSLQGVPLNLSLATDEDGNLRVSSDVKLLFDHFLTAIHEEDLDVITRRIEAYLLAHLQEPALGQAKLILSNYLSLKLALVDFESEQSALLKQAIADGRIKTTAVSHLGQQLEARNALRAFHLGPETHEAFFGDEERFDQYTLSRLSVISDPTLDSNTKQLRLATIDANAPADIIESRREAQIIDTFRYQEKDLLEAGASHERITEFRTQMFGQEAAERFAALDAERAEWSDRLQAYKQARTTILKSQQLTESDQRDEISRLREGSFNRTEQIRVKVFEKQWDAQAS